MRAAPTMVRVPSGPVEMAERMRYWGALAIRWLYSSRADSSIPHTTQKWGNLLACGAELTGMGPGVNEDVWRAASFFEPVDGEGKCLLGWHAGVA